MPVPNEARGERVERVLARLLPNLVDDLNATYYFLEHLPEYMRPEGVNIAAKLRMKMERLHKLLEEEEKPVVFKQVVPAYSEYEYPERTGSVFEEEGDEE